jgi:GTP1/Obg family GTP-binding protein
MAQALSPEWGAKNVRAARRQYFTSRKKLTRIKARVDAEYDIAVAKTPSPDTEPASDAYTMTKSIYVRKSAKEELLWAKTVAEVATKVTDVKTACAELKKATKKNVAVKVMKDAVKRFINVANENAEPLMTWEDVRRSCPPEARRAPTSRGGG